VKAFRRTTARVAVLDRPNVDTDQIIAKQFLKSISRTGFGQYLFLDWRLDENGEPRPEFELNNPAYAGAKILLTGTNFGCGSSREHAPWALLEYGFEVVVSSQFADIFKMNSIKSGLLPIELLPGEVRQLMDEVDRMNGSELTVDLEANTIVSPSGRTIPFAIDELAREELLEGRDEIGRTLIAEDAIATYEDAHPSPIRTTALAG
jgi:3-isopropylmalate/(R)-2-methylmalate dehydratase small subunit